MGRYSAEHQTAAGTNKTLMNLTGSAAVMLEIVDVLVGSPATPADVATQVKLGRTTDVGTGGTALTEGKTKGYCVTPTGAAVGGTFSAEPTFTDALLRLSHNQRAMQRFAINPDNPLETLVASGNGMAVITTASGGTPAMDVTMHWRE